MSDILKYIFLAVGTILGQILFDEFINVWPLFHIFIFPFFIISLPISINKYLYMAIAFSYGIAVDVFVDGVIGLSALSSLIIAYSRSLILKLHLADSLMDNIKVFNVREIGSVKYLSINFILYTLFIIVYSLIDINFTSSFIVSTLWIVVNIVLSVALSYAMSLSFMNRLSSRFNG